MTYFIGPQNIDDAGIESCSVEYCYKYLKNIPEIGVDIETTYRFRKGTYANEDIYKPGLDPYLSKIVMLQLGDLENRFVIDMRSINISRLLPLFDDKERVWVGHNLRFEAKHLKYNYGINFWRIWDTMLVEQNLTNGLAWSKNKNPDGYRYSLEALSARYLGTKSVSEINLFNQEDEEDVDAVYIDKSIRLGFLTIGDKPFTVSQIKYGAEDINGPLKIKQIQERGKNGYNPQFLHKLENDFCLVLADIELKGLGFNKEQWLKVYEEKKKQYQERLERLNNYIIRHHPKFCTQADLFGNPLRCNINWGSPDQVVKFFKHLGCCPKEKSKQTKRMEYTVGAKALTKLLPADYKELYQNDKDTEFKEEKDIILNYLNLKVSEQAVTTFGEDWLKYVHPITGRVHTSYKQILNTGRISSTKPNVQNIPSDEEYRKSFVAITGCKVINCDYSSQESRILAEVSGDEDMLSFFNNGHEIFKDDFHCFTATKMFRIMRNDSTLIINKKDHPTERKTAKDISFKVAYGGSAYTLKDDFGVEEDVAQQFIDGFLDAFPSLREYFDNGKKEAMKLGYIEIDPITGRRWYDSNFKRMTALNKKIWSYYPPDYKDMSWQDKAVVKEKIKKAHPEVRDMWSEYFSLKGKLERNSMNYKIQGLAGSQTKMAGILFRQYQLENNLQDKIYLTNLVHDEVCGEAQEGYEEQGRSLLEEFMEQGAMTFCTKVKMKAEAVLNDYWYH
jgi:DNA polymerase I-like protein with 3'-5' exonuclease and polymerase domains